MKRAVEKAREALWASAHLYGELARSAFTLLRRTDDRHAPPA